MKHRSRQKCFKGRDRGVRERHIKPIYDKVHRAYCAIIYMSGMRCTEAFALQMSDFTYNANGFMVTYKHAKSQLKGVRQNGQFHIPAGTRYCEVVLSATRKCYFFPHRK